MSFNGNQIDSSLAQTVSSDSSLEVSPLTDTAFLQETHDDLIKRDTANGNKWLIICIGAGGAVFVGGSAAAWFLFGRKWWSKRKARKATAKGFKDSEEWNKKRDEEAAMAGGRY
jgi:hypothetical protein